MHRFAVWAPQATRMAARIADCVHAMEGPDDRGWWRLNVNDAGHGTDYGFLVDDDANPYPDPRSAWQPNGVHVLSRTYDHSRFVWSDAQFQAPPWPAASFMNFTSVRLLRKAPSTRPLKSWTTSSNSASRTLN